MTSTRVILPTPCHNPTGHGRTPCTGQVTWEDHGHRRLGTCNLCDHDYVHDLGPYERHHAADVEEPAR